MRKMLIRTIAPLFLVVTIAQYLSVPVLAQQTPSPAVQKMRQGQLKFQAREYQDAIRLFEESIVLKPSAQSYQGLGAAYFELGNAEKALSYFDKAIELLPGKAAMYLNRSQCHSKLKNHVAAIRDLSEAKNLDPEKALLYLKLRGHEYYVNKNYREAVGDFEAVLKIDPKDLIAAQNLAEATKLNKIEEDNWIKKAAAHHESRKDQVALTEINRPIRSKWALIVGISKFKDTSLDLKYPSKDAQDFASFLVKEQNFRPDHVKVLTDMDATRANILSYLGENWLPKLVNKDDLVVFFFSGHGSPADMDHVGVSYLCPSDIDIKNLYATGISMQDLAKQFKERLACDRVILIIDACHSAATAGKGMRRTTNVDAEALSSGTGHLVICSSDKNERSWESTKYPNSVFTKWLIEGLRHGGSNTSLGDAFEFMKGKVHEEVLKDRGLPQTPVLKSRWQGKAVRLGTPTSH
jgi:tetratricopeptide (TPR) repeat protein